MVPGPLEVPGGWRSAPLGTSVGAYAVPDDLIESEQFRHRGFLRKVDDGRGGTLLVPGAPYRMTATPVEVGPAPALGSSTGFRSGRVGRPTLPPGRLLEGVRVLDFTWAAAGPYATLLLALLGAEVVKVETSRRPDPARRGFLADYGGVNRSPNFNELNLNKRAIQVDLGRPEGLELVEGLIGIVDVVVDNFRPGVMARFGFDPATLLERHPSLVVVVVGKRIFRPRSDGRGSGEHFRSDRRTWRADRVHRWAAH